MDVSVPKHRQTAHVNMKYPSVPSASLLLFRYHINRDCSKMGDLDLDEMVVCVQN